MIIVIADDFSGAAEIAGITWRYGLRAVLQTDIDLVVNHDIVIVDANTRSKSEDEARQIHKSIARLLNQSKRSWLFKKVDSVLRGHIIAEVESLATELGFDKILLAANNPSTGKLIKKNIYKINAQKLDETDFRFDPEFPVKSSVVTEILKPSNILPLTYIHKSGTISGSGIFIPEICTSEDLSQRAAEIDDETLPAGGSEFFESLLIARGYKPKKKQKTEENNPKRNRFFVLASTTEQSRKFCSNLKKYKIPVCNLPCDTAETSKLTDACLDQWVDDVRTSFIESCTVVSAIIHPVNIEPGFPHALNKFISQMIKRVIKKIKVDEILVEGGATTSHLVRYLGWKNFTPLNEYSAGVVKLKTDVSSDCKLIVKPGSYTWPDQFLPVDDR